MRAWSLFSVDVGEIRLFLFKAEEVRRYAQLPAEAPKIGGRQLLVRIDFEDDRKLLRRSDQERNLRLAAGAYEKKGPLQTSEITFNFFQKLPQCQ